MIKSFRCKDTQALFEGRSLRCFQAIEPVATRRLHLLDKARDLQRDIGGIPGNRLEKLHGDRAASGASASTNNGVCALRGGRARYSTWRSQITTEVTP